LASSGFPSLDKLLGHEGYPDRSAILIVGPPGIGKEALGYRFAYEGLERGEFSAYATTLAVRDVLEDIRAFGIETSLRVPFWLAGSGGQLNYNVNDLTNVSISIKEILRKNSDKRVRIVIESFSPFLMLNPPDAVYRFLSQLISEVRESNAILFGTLEEGMHSQEVLAAMQLLFDGVLEMRFYEEGLRLVPLMRIKKMRGAPPQAGYYHFSISRVGMEIKAYVK
jgi:KaiC/GvpD/RAD55 family RecA-like ATPase